MLACQGITVPPPGESCCSSHSAQQDNWFWCRRSGLLLCCLVVTCVSGLVQPTGGLSRQRQLTNRKYLQILVSNHNCNLTCPYHLITPGSFLNKQKEMFVSGRSGIVFPELTGAEERNEDCVFLLLGSLVDWAEY